MTTSLATAWNVGTVSLLQFARIDGTTVPPACGIARRFNAHMAATSQLVPNEKSSPVESSSRKTRPNVSAGMRRASLGRTFEWLDAERDFQSLVDNFAVIHRRPMSAEMHEELMYVEMDREDG